LFPPPKVRKHAPTALSTASVVKAMGFDTLERPHETTLAPLRNLQGSVSDKVQRTKTPDGPNSQTKCDHSDHARGNNLDEFSLAKGLLVEVKIPFALLFNVWDSE
jgi:hypothetical protein